MKKYKIKNLSCASCALKIEEGVAKLKDVNFVSVNFASSFIQVDTKDLEKVKSKIKEIEAEVEIIEDDREDEEEFNVKQELLKIFFIIPPVRKLRRTIQYKLTPEISIYNFIF